MPVSRRPALPAIDRDLFRKDSCPPPSDKRRLLSLGHTRAKSTGQQRSVGCVPTCTPGLANPFWSMMVMLLLVTPQPCTLMQGLDSRSATSTEGDNFISSIIELLYRCITCICVLPLKLSYIFRRVLLCGSAELRPATPIEAVLLLVTLGCSQRSHIQTF